jgi:hypothetical protein
LRPLRLERRLSRLVRRAMIAAALAEERGTVIPVLRQAIDELLDQEREHAKSELAERARSLELSVARLEAERRAPQDNRSAESADEDRDPACQFRGWSRKLLLDPH